MELNADFSQTALVHSEQSDWVASPMPGVERRMLDRIGGEVARATTIVRFAPQSSFSEHGHPGGEEFIVLEGVFQDQYGDFPAGTYVRNPPTTSHAPKSDQGCTIFVKLWQFDPDDRAQFDVNMAEQAVEIAPGVKRAELHKDAYECVSYFELEADKDLRLNDAGGIELLMLSGTARANGEALVQGSWLRLPDGEALALTSGSDDTRLWVKTGHLIHARAPQV